MRWWALGWGGRSSGGGGGYWDLVGGMVEEVVHTGIMWEGGWERWWALGWSGSMVGEVVSIGIQVVKKNGPGA